VTTAFRQQLNIQEQLSLSSRAAFVDSQFGLDISAILIKKPLPHKRHVLAIYEEIHFSLRLA
jgi:hypothetical protein